MFLLSHRLTYDICDSLIKCIRKNMICIHSFHVICEGFCCSDFHGISDRFFAISEHSLEYSWKGENIVHLIRIVTPTCSDDPDTRFMSDFWHNLRSRIRHRKDDRIMIHRACHIERECTSNGYSDEYIRTDHRINESSFTMFEIGEFEKLLFRDIERFTIFVNDSLRITGDDM